MRYLIIVFLLVSFSASAEKVVLDKKPSLADSGIIIRKLASSYDFDEGLYEIQDFKDGTKVYLFKSGQNITMKVVNGKSLSTSNKSDDD